MALTNRNLATYEKGYRILFSNYLLREGRPFIAARFSKEVSLDKSFVDEEVDRFIRQFSGHRGAVEAAIAFGRGREEIVREGVRWVKNYSDKDMYDQLIRDFNQSLLIRGFNRSLVVIMDKELVMQILTTVLSLYLEEHEYGKATEFSDRLSFEKFVSEYKRSPFSALRKAYPSLETLYKSHMENGQYSSAAYSARAMDRPELVEEAATLAIANTTSVPYARHLARTFGIEENHAEANLSEMHRQ